VVTASAQPQPGSRVQLQIEVPADEVSRHFATAYRHLADRTKIPGFRPGKAPRAVIDRYAGRGAVLAEAVEHLVDAGYDAALDQLDVIPIDHPDVDIDPATVIEGEPATFTATVSVRPDVTLGAYVDYPFSLEISPTGETEIDAVLNELADQQTTLLPIDGRPAATGDFVTVSSVGTIDGEPFDGGSSDRLPLVIGENRMIPGWEEHLVGLDIGGNVEFDITFPSDYRVEELAGKDAHFAVTLLDLRERQLPELDDAFAASVSEHQTLAALREEIADALAKRAEAEGRHRFGDRIIDFATSNATVELPEVMIANEVEIMRDEMRARLAQQRIGIETYLELTKKSPEELATELREPAIQRVKTLLVLSAVAEKEGIDADEAEVDAEVAAQLERYPDEARLREYLTSRRGRAYLRMTIRNRKIVEHLMDRALAASQPEIQPETE
jgi:trigger factor